MRRHFHIVLCLFVAFAKEMIKLPLFDQTPFEILKNMKYYPLFKVCFAAIDETHIPAMVPIEKAIPYRSEEKNECTLNVMIGCLLDIRFTWVWLRWEGSAYSFLIFMEATRRQNTNSHTHC